MPNSSCIRCIAALLLSAALACGENQREPHEPDIRGASAAGGGSDRETPGQGRSASLAEWRRQRDLPCKGGEHTVGRWVAKAAGEMEGAPCCHFYTENQEDFCGPRDARTEFWPWKDDTPSPNPPSAAFLAGHFPPDPFWGREERHVIKGRSDFLVHSSANSCSCKGWVDEFSWEPARCALAQWDAAAFCAALGFRKIMFIGDSTMMQAGTAVMNAVHWGMWNTSSCPNTPGCQHASGCQQQLSLGLSDTLIGVGLGAGNRGSRWVELVNRSHAPPDIVVISAGPHIRQHFQVVLDQVVNEHRTLFPEVKLVWQTSPGAGCATSPLEAPPDAAFWAQGPSYNWAQFPEFDAAARTRFGHPSSARANRFLLDVSPLALRADAHPASRGDVPGDCLHACLPGPVDRLVPRTLLHLLLHDAL